MISYNRALKDTKFEFEDSNKLNEKSDHKTVDTEFLGYKNHIIVSEERKITDDGVTLHGKIMMVDNYINYMKTE